MLRIACASVLFAALASFGTATAWATVAVDDPASSEQVVAQVSAESVAANQVIWEEEVTGNPNQLGYEVSNAIPEPATFAVLALGGAALLGLGVRNRARRS
jgi:hypothetical protein